MQKLNTLITHKDFTGIQSEYNSNVYNFINTLCNDKICKIKFVCDWCEPDILYTYLFKMTNNGYWNNHLKIVLTDYDYLIILNSTKEEFISDKTILIQYDYKFNNFWITHAKEKTKFHSVLDINNGYRILDWTLSYNYNELLSFPHHKTHNLTTIIGDRYNLVNNIKHSEFLRFLYSKNVNMDVYGSSKELNLNIISPDTKDIYFKYKYAIVIEDVTLPNYMTSKLADAILSECLIFYHGCYNIRDIMNNGSIVYLHLSNFEDDQNTILNTIANDEYTKRINAIKDTKMIVLNNLQLFSCLEKNIVK